MSLSKQQISKLKFLILRGRSGGGRRCRYSSEVKQLIREFFSRGASVRELCETSGITDHTIRKWVSELNFDNDDRPFRQILVSGDKTYEVILPNGVRIGGLSFDEVFKMATHAAA